MCIRAQKLEKADEGQFHGFRTDESIVTGIIHGVGCAARGDRKAGDRDDHRAHEKPAR